MLTLNHLDDVDDDDGDVDGVMVVDRVLANDDDRMPAEHPCRFPELNKNNKFNLNSKTRRNLLGV